MRLVAWAVAFAAGDALALCAGAGNRWTLAAGLATMALSAFTRGRWITILGAVGALALGIALGARAREPVALAPAVAAAADGEATHALVAVVARGPEDTGTGARLVVELASLDGAPVSQTLSLSVAVGWPDFGPGEVIGCDARLRPLRGTRNPGLPDPMWSLRAAGIDALASVPAAGSIRRLSEPTGVGPRRLAYLARRALRRAIDAGVGGEAAAFLRTAVLGERRGVSADVEDGFRAAGATHVLSVSGLHLAAVAALFFTAVRFVAGRVPRLPLYVDPRAIAAAASLPAIAFFTLLTGEAIATERAAIMLGLGMTAMLFGRRAAGGSTIAAAMLLLLIARPLALEDVSLQLSLASVAGIALVSRRLARRGPRTRAWIGRALAWLAQFGAATLAATAATAPLCAHWFGEIAPLAPLGNLALVPLVELAVVPLGLAGAVLGALWPPVGQPILAVAAAVVRGTLAIAALFHADAPVWVCRAPNAVETAALTGAGTLALLAVAHRPARKWLGGAALACAAVATLSLGARDWQRRHARALRVTFLDVGQGDSAVIEAPGGATMLIDGGGTRDSAFDTGARIVEPFLRARGISRVDVVALSHPHPDHLNGLLRVLDRFDVGALWSSGDDGHNPEYGRLIALARTRGIPTPEVKAMSLGAARVEPLGPYDGERIAAPPGLTVNDASLVLRITFGGRAVLFAGDLEADGEGELSGRQRLGQPIAADVLKVPHHGSRTSSSEELMSGVAPKLAVMSLGWRNQFHFPAPEVVRRYLTHGARVLRTDRDGAITVELGPDGRYSARCERGCGDGTTP
jgi:competence protein ComEC